MNITQRIIMQILACFSLLNSINAAVIFCDLGYTLVEPSQGKALSHLGFWSTVHCYFDFKRTYNLGRNEFRTYMHDFYLETLSKIPSPAQKKDDFKLLLPNQKEMPAILQDFMTGAITSAQALTCISAWAEQHENLFMNANHKDIFVRTAEFNFSDKLFVKSLRLLPCAQLLKQCAQVQDEQGKRKHVCIIVSNWAREQIEPFKKRFDQTLMPYIDGCIFSCDGYGPKPCESIYQRCNEIINNQFADQRDEPWFFIDDQPEHTAAAQQYLNHTLISCMPDQAKEVLTQCHIIAA